MILSAYNILLAEFEVENLQATMPKQCKWSLWFLQFQRDLPKHCKHRGLMIVDEGITLIRVV